MTSRAFLLSFLIFVAAVFAACRHHYVEHGQPVAVHLHEWSELAADGWVVSGSWTVADDTRDPWRRLEGALWRIELEYSPGSSRIGSHYHRSAEWRERFSVDTDGTARYHQEAFAITFFPDGRAELVFDEDHLQELGDLVPFEDTFQNRSYLVLNNLSLDSIRALISAGYQVTFEDLQVLHRGGVSPVFAVDIAAAGYRFSVADLVQLRRSGVSASFAKDLREGGWELTADELTQLRRSGVSADHANGMREVLSDPTVQEIIALRRSGVSAGYARELYEAGYAFGSEDLIALRRSGVSSQYAREVRDAGYIFSAEELISLRRAGVSSRFLADLQSEGIPQYPVESLIEFRRRGLSAQTIRMIREH